MIPSWETSCANGVQSALRRARSYLQATSPFTSPLASAPMSLREGAPRVTSRTHSNPSTRPFIPSALFSFFDGVISLPHCSQLIAQHLANSSSHVRTAAQEFIRAEGTLKFSYTRLTTEIVDYCRICQFPQPSHFFFSALPDKCETWSVNNWNEPVSKNKFLQRKKPTTNPTNNNKNEQRTHTSGSSRFERTPT